MTDYQQLRSYDVFTRLQRGDNLIQIGSFEAPDDDIATVYAQKIYDEQDWSEMHVVRQNHLIKVKAPDGLFEQEGVK
ncbi:hypothetical protein [Lentibacillus salinarum]|uniref:Uncharacterized protein n=1 Tax=Lentibacillus salinarum TaxID=446820 RepID=A0ABW3ZRY6_9BACI